MFPLNPSAPRTLGSLLPAFRTVPLVFARQPVYTAGEVSLLQRPCVSIIGSRDADQSGLRLACELSLALVRAGVVIVSGLALGVDVTAHQAAIAEGGSTVGVIGTGLDRAYPPSHAFLQGEMARDNLVVTPFAEGSRIHRSNFPRRNQLMAALTDATVVIQAGARSGTRHQVAACRSARLSRPVLLHRSLLGAGVPWARAYRSDPRVKVFETASDAIEILELEVRR